MGDKSTYLANKILDAIFNATSFSVTTVYVALTVSGTEVATGSYARTAGSFSAASSGAVSNDAAVTFPAPTANWGTVDGIKLYDASTSGNLLYTGALAVSRTINNGDGAPSFAIGDLDVTDL